MVLFALFLFFLHQFKHSLSQLGDLEVNLKHALDDDFAVSCARKEAQFIYATAESRNKLHMHGLALHQ